MIAPFSSVAEASKDCTRCGQVKALSDYHRDSRAKDGHKSRCAACALAAAEKRRKESPDKCNAAIAAAKAKKPEKYKAIGIKWQRAHPEKYRDKLRRDVQRMGETYLRRLLVAQGFGAFENIPAEIVELKRQQIETRRLARQLKKATHESSKDTDRIPGKHGGGDNAGRLAPDRGEQPVGAGPKGNQRHGCGGDGEGIGLNQQQLERGD